MIHQRFVVYTSSVNEVDRTLSVGVRVKEDHHINLDLITLGTINRKIRFASTHSYFIFKVHVRFVEMTSSTMKCVYSYDLKKQQVLWMNENLLISWQLNLDPTKGFLLSLVSIGVVILIFG